MNQIDNYNKYLVISKPFDYYRSYLYRVNNNEFITSDYLKLIYVIKGSITIELEDKNLNFVKGDLFFIGSNMSYKITQKEGINTMLVLDIKGFYLKRNSMKSYDLLYTDSIESNKNRIIKYMLSLYNLSIDNKEYSDEALFILNNISVLLNECSSYQTNKLNNGSVKSIIYEITNYIKNNLEEISVNNILLSEIADKFNINYHYLSRRFKEVVGLNYSDFLLYQKLNIAIDKLINTDDKISDIAKISYFRDSKSFNFNFKNVFEITPTEFRHKYSNFHLNIMTDPIHKEDSTINFFNSINKKTNDYFLESPKLNFNLDINTNKSNILNLNENILDLNSIIDINNGFTSLEQAFEYPFVKDVILNIFLSENNIYLLDKNECKVQISMYQLHYLINLLNNNNCRIYFIFNYELDKKLSNISSQSIIDILTFISSVLEFNHVHKNIFGIKLLNLKDFISLNDFKTINDYTSIFLSALDTIYVNKEYNWLFSIDNITCEKDIYLIEKFKKNIIAVPDKYLIDYYYIHNENSYKDAIKYYLNLTSLIRNILNTTKDSELIISFTYDITNTFSNEKYAIKFATLFCISLFLNFTTNGIRICALNYAFTLNNKSYKVNKYTHNPLGFVNSYYLITHAFKSLDNDLITLNNSLIATTQSNDLSFVLYDDYSKFYEYVKKSHIVNKDKKIEYKLDIHGLNGNYKIIEYTFDLSKDILKIDSDKLINISNEDKYLLSLSNKANLDLKFTSIDKSFTYKVSRNALSIKYVNFKKIS